VTPTDLNTPERAVQDCVDPRLHAEASGLLLALDRLMTVGTYYQRGHARHEAVAAQCGETVRRCLATRHVLDIEVTAEGLVVFDQAFPAATREARRIFSLADPLSLGVVRIRPGATAQQLQDAMAVLRTRKNNLKASTSYEEVEITGMPENVEAQGRALYLRTRTGGGDSLAGGSAFDPNLIRPEMLLQGADLHKSEAEFLKIVNGMIKTASGDQPGEDGAPKPGFDISKGLPQSALADIADIIEALVGTNSDPMVFGHLIAHAQSALQLTGDPELVELVFQNLRKEVDNAKPKAHLIGHSKAQKRKSGSPQFTMSLTDLDEAIDSVIEPFGPMENPESRDRAGALGICLQMLRTAPSDELVKGIHGTLRRIFGAPGFGGPEFRATAKLVIEIFDGPDFEREEGLFLLYWDMLREYRPEDVGPVWREVWSNLPPRLRVRVWPYTVNDILLGMTWNDPATMLALYGAVSRVPVAGNAKVRYKLENLSALREGTLADDIFDPPPPLLFPVLNVLIGTSLSPVLGPLLHDHLQQLQTHPLSVVMLEAAADYHPGNRVVYQAILEQGVRGQLTDRMLELGARLLSVALLRLPPGERTEPWLADAIEWLARIAPESAGPVLEKIVTEKKLLVIPAWPKKLREAAELAWETMGEAQFEVGAADEVGAFEVDDDAGLFRPSPIALKEEDTP